MSSSDTAGETIRALQLALRSGRCKTDFFQAGNKPAGVLNEDKRLASARKRGRPRKRKLETEIKKETVCTSLSPSSPSSPAKKPAKKAKPELMVIEEGDDVPVEHEPLFGHVVWAPFGSFHSYHPAVVIKGSMVNLATPDISQSFVFWFSDSKVLREKLLDFVTYFPQKGHSFHGKQGQQGVLKAIQELVRRAEMGGHSVMEVDLLRWAEMGFATADRAGPQIFRPGPELEFPDSVVERLVAIGADIREKAAQKDRDIPNEFHEESAITAVWQGTKNISDVCIGCGDVDRKVVCPHPVFQGGLCSKCKEALQEAFYAIGDDGTHSFCAVCGAGGQLFVCDTPSCGKVFCVPCIEELGGKDVLAKVKNARTWSCFICQPFKPATHGLLKPLPHWQQNLVLFFDMGHQVNVVPDLEYFKHHRPLRVLSLFDGIGTGLLALQGAGLEVEVYYASETDQQAIIISQANHGRRITQLGDVVSITKDKLAELVPIDLLIGGSPCNELSLANPLRKGFDVEGSGVLFFDYYRILKDLILLNGTTHLFWMYENVASMRTAYRNIISRFLQCQPAVWDAKHLTAQKRSRFFWGNIPGLYSTPEVSQALRREVDLNSVLTQQCQRQATVHCVRTITTQPNSLLQGRAQSTLPVDMAGAHDTLWLPELERLFGFPAHYTDVGNLSPSKRRALLGRSWSVQVVTEILRPLTQYFATFSKESDSGKSDVSEGNDMNGSDVCRSDASSKGDDMCGNDHISRNDDISKADDISRRDNMSGYLAKPVTTGMEGDVIRSDIIKANSISRGGDKTAILDRVDDTSRCDTSRAVRVDMTSGVRKEHDASTDDISWCAHTSRDDIRRCSDASSNDIKSTPDNGSERSATVTTHSDSGITLATLNTRATAATTAATNVTATSNRTVGKTFVSHRGEFNSDNCSSDKDSRYSHMSVAATGNIKRSRGVGVEEISVHDVSDTTQAREATDYSDRVSEAGLGHTGVATTIADTRSCPAGHCSGIPPAAATITHSTDCYNNVTPAAATITHSTDCQNSVTPAAATITHSADCHDNVTPAAATITHSTDCHNNVTPAAATITHSTDCHNNVTPAAATITHSTDCHNNVTPAAATITHSADCHDNVTPAAATITHSTDWQNNVTPVARSAVDCLGNSTTDNSGSVAAEIPSPERGNVNKVLAVPNSENLTTAGPVYISKDLNRIYQTCENENLESAPTLVRSSIGQMLEEGNLTTGRASQSAKPTSGLILDSENPMISSKSDYEHLITCPMPENEKQTARVMLVSDNLPVENLTCGENRDMDQVPRNDALNITGPLESKIQVTHPACNNRDIKPTFLTHENEQMNVAESTCDSGGLAGITLRSHQTSTEICTHGKSVKPKRKSSMRHKPCPGVHNIEAGMTALCLEKDRCSTTTLSWSTRLRPRPEEGEKGTRKVQRRGKRTKKGLTTERRKMQIVHRPGQSKSCVSSCSVSFPSADSVDRVVKTQTNQSKRACSVQQSQELIPSDKNNSCSPEENTHSLVSQKVQQLSSSSLAGHQMLPLSGKGQQFFPIPGQEIPSPAPAHQVSPVAGQQVSPSLLPGHQRLSSSLAGQQISPGTGQQMFPVTVLQISPVTGQQISPVTGQQISPVTGLQISPVTGQQISPVTGQQLSPVTGQQLSPVTGQQISPVTGQQISPVTGQQTFPVTGQQLSPVTGQHVSPVTGQQISPVAGQQTFPVTGQQISPVTGQQISPVAGQQTFPVTGQQVSSVRGQQLSQSLAGQQISTWPASGQQFSGNKHPGHTRKTNIVSIIPPPKPRPQRSCVINHQQRDAQQGSGHVRMADVHKPRKKENSSATKQMKSPQQTSPLNSICPRRSLRQKVTPEQCSDSKQSHLSKKKTCPQSSTCSRKDQGRSLLRPSRKPRQPLPANKNFLCVKKT